MDQNFASGFSSELKKLSALPSKGFYGVSQAERMRMAAKGKTMKAKPSVLEEMRRKDPHLYHSLPNPMPETKISASLPSPATVEHAAPVVKTLSSKIIDVIRKRPGVAAATAAAAGAGAGVGVAQAKKRKEEEEKRREAIRQLLMARLSEGGYLPQ